MTGTKSSLKEMTQVGDNLNMSMSRRGTLSQQEAFQSTIQDFAAQRRESIRVTMEQNNAIDTEEDQEPEPGHQRPFIKDDRISGEVYEAWSREGAEVQQTTSGFFNMATHTTELNKTLDKLFAFTYDRAKCGEMPALAYRSKLQKQVGFLDYCFEVVLDKTEAESEFICGLDIIRVLWKEPLQVLNRAEAERLIGYVATFADPIVSDIFQTSEGPGAQLSRYNTQKNNYYPNRNALYEEEDVEFKEYQFKLRKNLFLMQMEECFRVRMQDEQQSSYHSIGEIH